MEDRLAIAVGIECKANAGRDVIIWGERSAFRYTGVAGEKHTDGGQLVSGLAGDADVGKCVRLHALHEVRLPVLRVGRGLLPVVAHTQVDR
jgi:hypothetical protein